MKLFDYFLYAVVVFGWSTSWFPLKMQLGVVAPEVSIFWRFLIASFLMFVISFATKQTLRFSWRTHLRIAALGLCLFSCNFTLFYYAGLYTTSGLLAVMFSLASLINVLMVAVLTRSAPQFAHLIAALVGFGGVCLLFWPELQISETAVTTFLLCFMGTLFFCTGNMVSASAQKAGLSVIGTASWAMLYGAFYLGIFSAVRGQAFIIEATPVYVGSLIWLALISSVFTFSAFLILIGRIGAGRTGYATVIFPVFALLISTFLESYIWTWFSFTGLALVVLGNIIMVRSRA